MPFINNKFLCANKHTEEDTMINCGLSAMSLFHQVSPVIIPKNERAIFTLFICNICKYTELYSGDFSK